MENLRYLKFFNMLPMRLYWLAVETAKRIITKENIDRQLVGQSSLTPFMNIRDGYNCKKVVTYDTQDRLDDKIYKHASVMNKLTAQGNNQKKQF